MTTSKILTKNNSSLLDALNQKQKEAVEYTEGPLMILAGAGAGKTRVLTHRIAHLITKGVAPDRILAVTFTNKAAKEMRERVVSLIDSDPSINRPISARGDGMPAPYVATFHALGATLLRENATKLGVPRHFAIYDRADSIRAIKSAMNQLDIDPKEHEPRAILNVISRKKGDGITQIIYAQDVKSHWATMVARIWALYENILTKEGAFDFDDLLLHTLLLLRKHPQILTLYQDQWTYIHVDEYQDTNTVQFEIARILAGASANICVVGDIDQTIYTWRGADLDNLLSFESHFPNTKVVILEENYRSTQTILSAANEIIAKNTQRKEKNLFTKNAEGERITRFGAYGENDEAEFIVEKAGELIDSGVSAREIAVLYRANFQSRVLEEAFLNAGVPYQVLGIRFFERKEVKDILSYLRAALNPKSVVDISRIIRTPPRGIGKMTLAKIIENDVSSLGAGAQKKVGEFMTLLKRIRTQAIEKKPSETIRYIAKESGLEHILKHGGEDDHERLENIKELVTFTKKYDQFQSQEGIEKLLQDAALATDQDSLEKNTDAVKLMTVHASKGLEFDHVFIAGLEDGLFPHNKSDAGVDKEEERRLFYVALTRARKKVYLTHAMTRTIYGSQQVNIPSEFLSDIDAVHIDDVGSYAAPQETIGLIDF